jgi:hypothetical protein
MFSAVMWLCRSNSEGMPMSGDAEKDLALVLS